MNRDIIDRAAEAMWRRESVRSSGRDRPVEWSDVNPDIAKNWRDLAEHSLKSIAPKAIAEQACTISKMGSRVYIDCNNYNLANEMFEWLTQIPIEQVETSK